MQTEKTLFTKNRIAKFYKISFERFLEDYKSTFNSELTTEEIKEIWDMLELPTRATKGSAGYDFKTPIDFVLRPNETIKIPTGIRCEMANNWVLQIYPRSSLGFKYRMQLDNSVAIVDSDYFNSDNEGHIFIKITNDSNENKVLAVKTGQNLVQGIFIPYGLTVDDNCDAIRYGGIGSTDKEKLTNENETV